MLYHPQIIQKFENLHNDTKGFHGFNHMLQKPITLKIHAFLAKMAHQTIMDSVCMHQTSNWLVYKE